MEYLSQPFKLNSSGLESTITISLRLVFMKVWDDDDNKTKQDDNVIEDNFPMVGPNWWFLIDMACISFNGRTNTKLNCFLFIIYFLLLSVYFVYSFLSYLYETACNSACVTVKVFIHNCILFSLFILLFHIHRFYLILCH